MAVPGLDDATGLDTSDPIGRAMGDGSATGTKGVPKEGEAPPSADAKPKKGDHPDADEFLMWSRSAHEQSANFFATHVRKRWARSYKAASNEHDDGSKYRSAEYRGRSRIFRPKTRAALKKKLREAASALFSTGDIVSVQPSNEADDFQRAAASLKQELLNYRLDRTTMRNGIRWFQTAMGAVRSAHITGLIASYQSWIFKEEDLDEPKQTISTDPTTGATTITMEFKIIVQDRPDIKLLPPENVLFDPNCDWVNPAQSAQYVQLRFPMAPDEAFAMTESPGRIPWLDVSEKTFYQNVSSPGDYDTIASRTAREGGVDPLQMVNGRFGRVWVSLWFMRVKGKDYTFWTLDNRIMLSEPVQTRTAYPEQKGERPIVIGYGAIEEHRSYPMSTVESLQPLQQEINDQTNLRLDHLKQIVQPPRKAKRGANVDLSALNRFGANRTVMLDNMDDLQIFDMPDTPQGAFMDANVLNADFDDLAGTFNSSSVNTNKQLNETVGGLNLLSGDASSTSEFDLSVVVETWVAPVLTQVMNLEEMYEDDQNVLAIAGERAQLWQKYGVDAVTDKMLEAETSLVIKAGVGATNLPQERIQRFAMAWQASAQALAPMIQAGVIQPPKPNVKEIIETLFGAAGFRDGGDRFFVGLDDGSAPAQQKPDPHAAQMQAAQMQAEVKQRELMFKDQDSQRRAAVQMAQIQQKETDSQRRASVALAHDQAANQQTKLKALAELGRASADMASQRGRQAADHSQQLAMQGRDHAHQTRQAQRSNLSQMLGAGMRAATQPLSRPAAPRAPGIGAPPAQSGGLPQPPQPPAPFAPPTNHPPQPPDMGAAV